MQIFFFGKISANILDTHKPVELVSNDDVFPSGVTNEVWRYPEGGQNIF